MFRPLDSILLGVAALLVAAGLLLAALPVSRPAPASTTVTLDCPFPTDDPLIVESA